MSADHRDQLTDDQLSSDLSAELPPPRDDEPTSLRQDILDELTDHLNCSTYQESFKGRNRSEAVACAIERFGNPAEIASQLWFDAMKGTIMQQKLLMFLVGAMTVVCGFMAIGMWQARKANQEMTKAMLAAVQLRQAEATISNAPAEWCDLKVEVQRDGKPVPDVTVHIAESNMMPSCKKTTDDEGRCEFGTYKYGEYLASLTFRDEGIDFCSDQNFTIMPGQDKFVSITIPASLKDEVGVKLTGELAADNRESNNELQQRLWTAIWLIPMSPDTSAQWLRAEGETLYWLLVDPEGNSYVIAEDEIEQFELDRSEMAVLREDPLGKFSNSGWKVPTGHHNILPHGDYFIGYPRLLCQCGPDQKYLAHSTASYEVIHGVTGQQEGALGGMEQLSVSKARSTFPENMQTAMSMRHGGRAFRHPSQAVPISHSHSEFDLWKLTSEVQPGTRFVQYTQIHNMTRELSKADELDLYLLDPEILDERYRPSVFGGGSEVQMHLKEIPELTSIKSVAIYQGSAPGTRRTTHARRGGGGRDGGGYGGDEMGMGGSGGGMGGRRYGSSYITMKMTSGQFEEFEEALLNGYEVWAFAAGENPRDWDAIGKASMDSGGGRDRANDSGAGVSRANPE